MKFVMMFVVFAAFCGNAAAQTQTGSDANVEISSLLRNGDTNEDQTPAALPTVEQCLADLEACRQDIGAQTADAMNLLIQLAERQGYASVDDMLAADCRSRRGTWSGSGESGQCLCAEPNHWFGTETHPETCCVPSTHRYENQMHSCTSSGGNFSCRGGCRCPMGTQLLDGECTGEAATREEVDRLRGRIPELEQQIATLQAERDALRAQLDQTLSQLDELDNLADTVGEMEQRLVEMDAELSFLRHLRSQHEEFIARQAQTIADLGGIPPLPPGVPDEDEPLPGTREAIAAAASSNSNPLAPTPPPSEEDEEGEGAWCNEGFGQVLLCYILPAVATAGLVVGICAAAGCFDEEPRNRIYY